MKTAIPAILAAAVCLGLVGWASLDGYRETNCFRVLDIKETLRSGSQTYGWVTYQPGVAEWVCESPYNRK